MKIIFDDGKEIEFDENEVGILQDHRERIFKKDGIWYITKIINKDFAKWIDETKPMIIKIPEKIDVIAYDKCIHEVTHKEKQLALEIRETQIAFNEIIDYLKSKGE